jgi:protein required for attachment to host cells
MDVSWIVVADEGRARIFESSGAALNLQEVEDFSNAAHSATTLTDKDAETFSPGERKEKERDNFAAQVAEVLEKGRVHQRYSQLRLIAEPKFLGMLLSCLSHETQRLVSEKLSKDFSSFSTEEISERLK